MTVAPFHAVIRRMLYGWRPSVTHRQWFRTSHVGGEVRQPMTDAEAEAIDAVYAKSTGDGEARD